MDTARDCFQDMMAEDTIDDRAQEIASILLFQSSVESILEILDRVTEHPAMPEQLRNFPIGQCVRAMMSVMSCYNKIKKNKTKDGMVHKHILLSSLVYSQANKFKPSLNKQQSNRQQRNNNNENSDNDSMIDANELYVYTKPLMQVIANRNTSIIDKCIRLRNDFNAADNCIKLYDIDHNNKKSKVQDIWNQIDESIVSFWHDNT